MLAVPSACTLDRLSAAGAERAVRGRLQGVREVEEWMSQTSGIPLEELRPHMFLLRDRDATSHLMRCAPWALPQAARNVHGAGRAAATA